VAVAMPATTAVPTDQRAAAPAPEDSNRGINPKTYARAVNRTARKRSRAPSTAASKVE
jgi:hypothetical protein